MFAYRALTNKQTKKSITVNVCLHQVFLHLLKNFHKRRVSDLSGDIICIICFLGVSQYIRRKNSQITYQEIAFSHFFSVVCESLFQSGSFCVLKITLVFLRLFVFRFCSTNCLSLSKSTPIWTKIFFFLNSTLRKPAYVGLFPCGSPRVQQVAITLVQCLFVNYTVTLPSIRLVSSWI